MVSAVFDEPNLVSAPGLVPIMKLAFQVGLRSVSDRLLTVPTDKGAHPGLKESSLVAGMLAGADTRRRYGDVEARRDGSGLRRCLRTLDA